MKRSIAEVMELAPVIPVLVIDRLEDAEDIATALAAGGLFALEVTLRTPCALDVIKAMSKIDGVIVGAGTVLNPAQLEAAADAGAEFIVSPGLTENLGKVAGEAGIAYLPGVSTAADIMRGMDLGLSHFKFFPAETSGGLPALKALASPFHEARFCPTGGIRTDTARNWLDQPFVKCVGGSWVVPKGPVDMARVQALASAAAALKA